jgi:hypothetical protein
MSDHALDNNDTLKNAKDIEWFNDTDSDTPIPPSCSLMTSSSVSSIKSFDGFFSSHPSAKMVAGKHHLYLQAFEEDH